MLAWFNEIVTLYLGSADDHENFPLGVESVLSADILEQLSTIPIK